MNTLDARAVARNHANRRLRRLTVGATALGILATGGLSLTAAISNDGNQATGDAIALVATGDAGTSSSSSAGTTSTSSSSNTATPSITGTTGVAHASTGGS